MKRSRTRRVSFFVPMLTAALIVVGWRAASAGPCISDGQTCRTDQSCCGGVCVKSSKKSFGTCCSSLTTCAAEGANCGMIADGCGGTLDCGTCTLPQTCGGGGTPNVCGAPGVCGNGIVEYPEWCDGESFCASNCTIVRYACCQFATGSGGCSKDVPAFTLFANQYGVCGTYGGTFEMGLTAPAGSACTDPPSNVSGLTEGACVEPPPLAAPINLCCQDRYAPVCGDVSTASNSAITQFIWSCAYRNYPDIPIVRGTCGGDGLCVFAP